MTQIADNQIRLYLEGPDIAGGTAIAIGISRTCQLALVIGRAGCVVSRIHRRAAIEQGVCLCPTPVVSQGLQLWVNAHEIAVDIVTQAIGVFNQIMTPINDGTSTNTVVSVATNPGSKIICQQSAR